MSGIQPVSRDRHSGARWHRYQSYGFTAATSVVPIAAVEVGKAVLALPLVFTMRDESWGLAALLGLLPDQNLFVDGKGSWLAEYIPAAFRGYPFQIGTQSTGEATLCVHEDSGLVTEGPEGESFFDEGGELSPSVSRVWSFLQEAFHGEATMRQASNLLASLDLIEPWPITVQSEQGTQQIVGIYRINEIALNGLDDEAFGRLRRSGVLAVVYGQLLSMGHFGKLGQLAQARAQAEAADRARAEVKPMITLPEDNTIDWDWSKIGR